MSGFVSIAVDGTLTHHDTDPDGDQVRQALGGWFGMVDLQDGLMGFVDDDGHPKLLPINPVGTVTLQMLGARHPGYVGPVVITGWHRVTEIVPLSPTGLLVVRAVHKTAAARVARETGAAR